MLKLLIIGLLPLSMLTIALPTGAESSILLSENTAKSEVDRDDTVRAADSADPIAQEALSQATIAQITDIRFQPSESGLDLILETRNGDNIQAFSNIDGNTLILDLVGVQLNIDAERYLADSPTDAVSSLSVETVDEQTVRISIAGIETLPEANLAIAGEEFIVSLPGVSTIVEVPAPEEPTLVAPSEATADIAEITNIRLQSTALGAELLLETSNGDVIQPFSTVEGNTLILDLTNARLALPEGDRYSVNNPIEEVSSLNVETLNSQSIRLTIVGIEALPEANLSITGEEFIVDIPSAATIAQSQDSLETSDSGTLRIGVTGQEDSFTVENASTATRTDTPLDQVPQSIQVIPRAVLDEQQVVTLTDALRNASGVLPNANNVLGERFISRGFSSTSILRDGFRLSNGSSFNTGFQEIANLERIEVLKGPSAILAGVTEPGGAINLISKQPLSEPFYRLGFGAGSREFIEPNIDFSGPLSEDGSVLYRLNALYRREKLDRNFDVPVERYFIAPTVTWAANDRTDFTFSFEYSDQSRPTDLGLVAIGDRVARIPFDRITEEPGDETHNTHLRVGYLFEHRFSDEWKIRNTFRHIRFNNEGFTNATLSVNEVTGDLFRIWAQDLGINSSYELQTNVVGEFNTGAIEHTLLAGIDLFRRDVTSGVRRELTLQPTFNIFDPVYGQVSPPESFNSPPPLVSTNRTNSFGVYLQDQISFSDDFFALLGIRYDTVTIDTENFSFLNVTDSQSSDAFTPRIGFVYKPIEELSLYTSYSTSFSPNSQTDISGQLLEPEEGQQFEVGARAELLDGRLTANVAFFNITKQNVATLDPDSPPGQSFFVTTGEQRSQGIEFDLIGEILPGWNIAANYAYTDADITEDNTGNEGNRLFGTPEHNVNLWTSYEIQDGDLAGLQLGVGFNLVSDRFGDNANTFLLDEYFLTNAVIAYRRDNWRVSLNVRNLFDVDYISSASNRLIISPGDGLTILGNIFVEF